MAVPADLEVCDLTVDFGGIRALDEVSLRVDAGRCVGLIGPNGAGKTTLFDAVLGVVTPTAGSVGLFGTNVDGWPMHRRARLGLGRTFQRLELFDSLSVIENVIVALESKTRAGGIAAEVMRRPASIDASRRAHSQAEELLDLVGLTEQANSRAGGLPMGLARALELARALATEPKLLLLDEPSSGLNDEESRRLATLLRTLADNSSFLIVEHDMTFVLGLSDDVYVLDFGKVIAHGAPDQITNDDTVRAAYLGQEIG